MKLPSLYISHGSPMLLLQPQSPAHQFLSNLGSLYDKPKAILVISAHWEADELKVTARTKPEIIYDFKGFPDELYQKEYPISGDPQFAQHISQLTGAKLDQYRGIDHGVWVPLYLMYPEADIPVLQLSLSYKASPQQLYEIGERISVLRQEGVLIIASGAMTHNLRHMERFSEEIDEQALAAENWLVKAIDDQNVDALRNALDDMPFYKDCHPTNDHWFPIYVALGAANKKTTLLHKGIEHKSISMLSVQFD